MALPLSSPCQLSVHSQAQRVTVMHSPLMVPLFWEGESWSRRRARKPLSVMTPGSLFICVAARHPLPPQGHPRSDHIHLVSLKWNYPSFSNMPGHWHLHVSAHTALLSRMQSSPLPGELASTYSFLMYNSDVTFKSVSCLICSPPTPVPTQIGCFLFFWSVHLYHSTCILLRLLIGRLILTEYELHGIWHTMSSLWIPSPRPVK